MVSWGLSRSIDRVALIPGCRCISWTFARLIRLPLGSSGRRYISSSFALGISCSALLFPGVARLSRAPVSLRFHAQLAGLFCTCFHSTSALIAWRVLPERRRGFPARAVIQRPARSCQRRRNGAVSGQTLR
ncbi:hypothetical protein C8F01DRAFT_556097 [Mycena amicta]|nr:hypothetical protein C8F01DRAFT_556097 [Mycena amicta]